VTSSRRSVRTAHPSGRVVAGLEAATQRPNGVSSASLASTTAINSR
jgi:hypothetical protein